MVEEVVKKEEITTHEQLRSKAKVQTVEEIKDLVSIRNRIERDYNEDVIEVEFSTSPSTKRTVKAKRPTTVEMVSIMEISSVASIYEGSGKPESLSKMIEIYKKLSTIAASLCIDKKLDKDFWDNKVSSNTLQNFITALISEAQRSTRVLEKDVQKFR